MRRDLFGNKLKGYKLLDHRGGFRNNAGRKEKWPGTIKEKKYAYLNTLHGRVKNMLWDKKTYCQKNNIPFDLDYNWLKPLIRSGICQLSGVKLHLVTRGNTGLKPRYIHPMSPSIDRIDPKKGYIKSNCRIIAWCVNAFKQQMTDDDVIKIAQAIVDFNKSGNNQKLFLRKCL